jgi:hypothetical protein
VETWKGIGDRGRYREGYSRPVPFRSVDSFEIDRAELGRDAAVAWALETLAPTETVERRLGIEPDAE